MKYTWNISFCKAHTNYQLNELRSLITSKSISLLEPETFIETNYNNNNNNKTLTASSQQATISKDAQKSFNRIETSNYRVVQPNHLYLYSQ